MILPDSESRVDLLNNEAIAATIISVLRARADEPVTIGVHGDWGAGKSTILELIEASLAGGEGVLCIKFNGWRFQGFEDAKIALIEGIVTTLIEKRPALTKAAGVVKNLFTRIDWMKVAKRGGGLALTAFTGIPSPDLMTAALGTLNRLSADPKLLAPMEDLEDAANAIKSLLKEDAPTKNVPEEIDEFRKAFDQLLKEAEVEQLVVLIDDLDRCLPDTAIETLEAVRLFVFTARTAFVVAADEAMIEYAVRKHFPELPETTGPRDYARNYLEKLIQVPFRIPALGEAETRLYVLLLLIGADVGESDARYVNLIEASRERLRRPWEGVILDAAAVRESLGAMNPAAQNALMLSDQIGPILAAGSRGNPRQIKRFLNTLLLRQKIADARGFGGDIKPPVLAKLMLAERFIPRLFEQIATAAAVAADGRAEELARLEAAARDFGLAVQSGGSDANGKARDSDVEENTEVPRKRGSRQGASRRIGAAKSSDTASAPESAVLKEWLASAPVREWAQVEPAIGEVDLRPYLFVTKDRKDYFGATSAIGHLAAVVDRLLGPKMSVQSMLPELAQLKPPEAAQVFESLRSRIMGTDTFEAEPNGIAGLTILVRAHPMLQPNLLAFLDSLPLERLGPWAVKGWEGVFTDPGARARFDQLLERWHVEEENVMLSTAAGGALRTRKERLR